MKNLHATYLVDFPVTVSVNVRKMFGGRISSFNTFDSVANGNPLSSISSSNWQTQNAISGHKAGAERCFNPFHIWYSKYENNYTNTTSFSSRLGLNYHASCSQLLGNFSSPK